MADYFVSSSLKGADDKNDGRSQSTPWKSLKALFVNQSRFKPGDTIRLRRGDAWEGQIRLEHVHGSMGNPVSITTYGSAKDPSPVIYGSLHTGWAAMATPKGVYRSQSLGSYAPFVVCEESGVVPTSVPTRGKSIEPHVARLQPGSFWPQLGSQPEHVYVRSLSSKYPKNHYVYFNAAIWLRQVSFLIIEGLTIKASRWAIALEGGGISGGSDHVSILNNRIEGCFQSGINLAGALTAPVTNTIIENNVLLNMGNTAIHLEYANDTVIRGNTISDVSDYVLGGFRFGDQAAVGMHLCTGTIVESNSAFRIVGNAVDCSQSHSCQFRYNFFSDLGAGITLNGSDHLMHSNIVHVNWPNSPSGRRGFGVSIEIRNEGKVGIYQNVFSGLNEYGIVATAGDQGGIGIMNNIFIATTPNPFLFGSYNGKNCRSERNIFCRAGKKQVKGPFKRNLKQYNSLEALQEKESFELGSMIADPELAGSSLQAPKDFAIRPGSPGVDSGANLEDLRIFARGEYQDFNGERPLGIWDIGVFQTPSLDKENKSNKGQKKNR